MRKSLLIWLTALLCVVFPFLALLFQAEPVSPAAQKNDERFIGYVGAGGENVGELLPEGSTVRFYRFALSKPAKLELVAHHAGAVKASFLIGEKDAPAKDESLPGDRRRWVAELPAGKHLYLKLEREQISGPWPVRMTLRTLP